MGEWSWGFPTAVRAGFTVLAGAGEVVEWLMAPVLKTGDPQGSVGSNPTLSVSGLKTGIPEGSRDVPREPETRCTAPQWPPEPAGRCLCF